LLKRSKNNSYDEMINVSTTEKIRGYSEYLAMESTRSPFTRTVYTYVIPKEKLNEALRKGAQHEPAEDE